MGMLSWFFSCLLFPMKYVDTHLLSFYMLKPYHYSARNEESMGLQPFLNEKVFTELNSNKLCEPEI